LSEFTLPVPGSQHNRLSGKIQVCSILRWHYLGSPGARTAPGPSGKFDVRGLLAFRGQTKPGGRLAVSRVALTRVKHLSYRPHLSRHCPQMADYAECGRVRAFHSDPARFLCKNAEVAQLEIIVHRYS
jgi:hypothetical protein